MLTNLFEAVANTLKVKLDNEPKSPLHVGEVMSCWVYVAMMDEASIFMQAGVNMTSDDELLQMLKDSIEQCDKQSRKLKDFMKTEGVHLPNVSEPRPNSDPNSVPLGVKLTDEEIANGVSIKTASAIIACATGASQSIRTDLGTIWVDFLSEKLLFGTSLKTLLIKRGWIKVPPYYYPPGQPQQ